MDCKRRGNFAQEEYHQCFVLGCSGKVHPATSKSCPVCNFKVCENGHCACNLTPDARHAVNVLYETYCEFCKEAKP